MVALKIHFQKDIHMLKAFYEYSVFTGQLIPCILEWDKLFLLENKIGLLEVEQLHHLEGIVALHPEKTQATMQK